MTYRDRCLAVVSLVLAAGVAVTTAGPWRVAQPDVRITCPLTVGGSFQAKSSALSGTLTVAGSPSSLDGALTLDLRTIDTGISLRNDHLREKYLEVDKAPGYDKALLSGVVLQGVSTEATNGKGTFTGSLTLHGTTRSVGGPVEVRTAGGVARVKASFPLKLSEYNIPEPRYLGVGVRDTVQIEVTFSAAPASTSQLRVPGFVGHAASI